MKAILFTLALLAAGQFVSAHETDFIARLREAELAGNRAEVAAVCQAWYASGQYSIGLLQWNYNALMSVEANALLFTGRESDTYPAIMLQQALGVRPDVRVLNLQLIDHPGYRHHVVSEEALTWVSPEATLETFLSKVFKQSDRPVYLGSMIDKDRLSADRRQLYLTGLALKFSQQPFDNLAMLRFNYERRFHTEYLELPLGLETDPAAVAAANLNYLPAFILLYRHYTNTGETAKADALATLSQRIARAGGKESELMGYFAAVEPEPAPVSGITVKSLEKRMKKVSANLYASETEVSNAEYEAFLLDLLKNKEFDLINRCQMGKTDWAGLLPDTLRQLNEKQLFPHGHPDGPDFPVQNIRYEAAEAYCQWMTKVYNNSSEKKKFKRVVFRLPSAAEWETAAQAGRGMAIYPWGAYFVRNSKGCYLGNFNVSTRPCDNCSGKNDASNDGGIFPVKITSYFPNDFGLYNMSGNVAEMINEHGKCKGGSWRQEPYFGQIQQVLEFQEPSPAIGFRIFMEVLEY